MFEQFRKGQIRRRWSHFRSDSDINEEIRVHSEMEAEDYRARGASDEEAKRTVRLELGDRLVAIEKIRDGEWLTVFEGWYRDVISGVRALRRNPVFLFTAVLTLGLGIGANTAIFSLLYGLILRSIPTRAPSELIEVGFGNPDGIGRTMAPYRMLRSLNSDLNSVTDVSGWFQDEAPIEDKDGSLHRYSAGLVTGNAFETVPVRAYLGRLIAPFDDVRGGPAQGWPVVLSYGFWSDRYGKDGGILGKQIRICGTPVTVIGVTTAEFRGLWPGTDIKLYLPMQFVNVLEKEDVVNQENSFFPIAAIGRLRPGSSIAIANADAARLQKRLFAEYIPMKLQHNPFFVKTRMSVRSVRSGLPTYITRTYKRPLYLMQGLLGIVLLLCCVNVGGLMMSKVYSRQREFAVRTALGAQSWRLVRQYLTESFIVAFLGSMLGALLAWRGCDILLRFFRDPMMGQPMEVQPDRSILFPAAFLAILATLLFGALPAWRAGHADPGELLKSRTSLGGKRHIAGKMFIPIQVALSVVLVVFASLLSQSILKLRSEHTGFDIDHVTIQNSPLYLIKTKGEAKLNLYQRMVSRLDELPGVRSAAVTSRTSMTGEDVMSRFQTLGGANQTANVALAFDDVGPRYFQTMKTRIVAGRDFTANERSLNVCILNRSAAAFLFPGQQGLGQYVRATDDRQFPAGTTCRVIGIAEDAKFSDVREGPPHTIYFPVSLERFDTHIGNLVFLINSDSKPEAISAFRQTLTEIAPSLPLSVFVTLREQMDAALGSQELITLLSNFFGLVSLLLSALGLYGLLSASIVQRTGEIGIRVALGADRMLVIRMVLREALGMVGWGMAGGGILLLLTSRFVAAMLHGVSSFDPITLIVVGVVLTAVAFMAALAPALKAATIDPVEALRTD